MSYEEYSKQISLGSIKQSFLGDFIITNWQERMLGIEMKNWSSLNPSPSLRAVRNRRQETVSLPKYKLK